MIEYWVNHNGIYKLIGKKGYFRNRENDWCRWTDSNESILVEYVRRVGRQVVNDFELAYWGIENDN